MDSHMVVENSVPRVPGKEKVVFTGHESACRDFVQEKIREADEKVERSIASAELSDLPYMNGRSYSVKPYEPSTI